MFMRSLLTPSYEHRKPIFKNGSDSDDNIQLLSELVNRKKIIFVQNVKVMTVNIAH